MINISIFCINLVKLNVLIVLFYDCFFWGKREHYIFIVCMGILLYIFLVTHLCHYPTLTHSPPGVDERLGLVNLDIRHPWTVVNMNA